MTCNNEHVFETVFKLFKNEMYIVRSNHDIIDDIEDATDDDEIPTFDENAAKRLKWKYRREVWYDGGEDEKRAT